MTTTSDSATVPASDEAMSASLARVASAVTKAASGEISYSDLLKLIAPEPTTAVVPAEAPKPAVITTEQRVALAKLTEVFGVVAPDSRRTLTVPEIASLVDERVILDEIATLVETRKTDGIREAVANHLDLLIDQEAAEAAQEGREYALPPKDVRGHYVREGRAVAPDKPKAFSRETRSGGVAMDPDVLRLLADDPSLRERVAEVLAGTGTYDHDDYLAMTRSTRVWDEAKVMMHLRTHPHLVHVLKLAITSHPRQASIYMRKP